MLTLLLSESGVSITPDLSGVEIANTRRVVNFHGQNFVRLHVDSSITTITIRVEYSLNDGQAWSTLVSFATLQSTAPSVSSWITIPQEAKVEVLLRALGVGLTGGSIRFVNVESHG